MSDPRHIELARRIAGKDCGIQSQRNADDVYIIHSHQIGGRFEMTYQAIINTTRMDNSELALLRRRIWERLRSGGQVRLTSYDLDAEISTLSRPTFTRMAFDLLELVERTTETIGSSANIPLEEVFTILCVDTGRNNELTPGLGLEEVSFFWTHLASKHYIVRGEGEVRLTPEGLIYLEERRVATSKSEQGFVAMWFHPGVDALFDLAIYPGIRNAGYRAYRVDKQHHPNKVDDEIVAQIRKSRFLVADFTCELTAEGKHIARGGVYFEAGFAMGLNIPVIWCARKDCIDGVHFDTRQYPHLLWQEPMELKDQLTNRIEALIGRGPVTTSGPSGKSAPGAVAP